MRVLIARAGALGDLLLLRPALWRLRAHGAAVTLLAPARTARLLVGAHACLADTLLDSDGAEAAQLFAGDVPAAWQTPLRACDMAIAYTRSADLVQSLRRLLPDLRTHDPQPPPGTHAASWLCEPIRRIGFGEPPPLPPLPAAAVAASELVVHAGSGSARKNWPPARFVEAARRLCPSPAWLWLVGPADRGLPEPPQDARARMAPPLEELAALLAGTRLYLGNDSGVTHLAAAVGAPTLALFGPTQADSWSPVGPRVRTLQAPAGDLDALTVESVVSAGEALRATP